MIASILLAGISAGILAGCRNAAVSRQEKDLRKIELYDAIPWKINLVCRKNTVNDKVISRLQEICCNLD